MGMEFPEQKSEIFTTKHLEISLKSENDFKKLTDWLTVLINDNESAEQCVFALHSMIESVECNQCDDASKEFGRKLNERFGGEESFFDLAPSASFSIVRSYDPLDKVNYIKAYYHSVGLIEFILKNKEKCSLIFDLTYGKIAGYGRRDEIRVIYSKGTRVDALGSLKKQYGGMWEAEMELDKKSGNFKFLQKA